MDELMIKTNLTCAWHKPEALFCFTAHVGPNSTSLGYVHSRHGLLWLGKQQGHPAPAACRGMSISISPSLFLTLARTSCVFKVMYEWFNKDS